MRADLLLLTIVKVSYADGSQLTRSVVAVSRQVATAAQLQFTRDFWVGIISSSSPPLGPFVVLIRAIPGGGLGRGEGITLL